MNDLFKAITLNAWYSDRLTYKEKINKLNVKREQSIRYNKYGFITNPFIESNEKKSEKATNENDYGQ